MLEPTIRTTSELVNFKVSPWDVNKILMALLLKFHYDIHTDGRRDVSTVDVLRCQQSPCSLVEQA